jgi:GT2 family glycosyltransferase
MRLVSARRLKRELDELLPWPEPERRAVLLDGFLDPVHPDPLVSIIIPVYGKLDYTVRCLLSVGACNEAMPFEIIVVDDGSPDETSEVLSRCPGIRYFRNDTNSGFIASVNRGALAARGRYLHFLNNDTVAIPGFLDHLVDTIASVPRAGLVGSKLIYPSLTLQEAGGVVWRDASATNWGNGRDPFNPTYSTLRDVDYVSGASLLIERALFERLGGFDTHYAPAYYEDTDLAFRVRALGYRVLYQPASRIIHHEGATSGTDLAEGPKRHQVENRRRFLERWKDVLKDHGAYGETGPRELDRVSGASVLILDSRTPKPDHDSGSIDMINLLRVFRALGCRTTFMPVLSIPRALPIPNVQPHAGAYTEALQRMGVECAYLPYERSVERFLRERGGEFDLVLLHRARVADRFLPDVRRHCPRAKVVFNTVDLCFLREEREAKHYDSTLLSWKAADTRKRELRAIADADMSLVLSGAEAELLAHEAPGAEVRVAPLLREVPGLCSPRDGRKDVLFVGHFRHRPNGDAVRFLVSSIWPHVRDRLPGVRLHIVGSKTPASIRALAAEDVVVHGFVENLDEMFRSIRISVAPLRYGAGLKGKVAESLGRGVPCVSTTIGVEGSGLRDGEEILVADDPKDFADAIVRAYTDDALWDRLSAAGVDFVRAQYSLETHAERFRALFAELDVQVTPTL